jgi:hypothetical protein
MPTTIAGSVSRCAVVDPPMNRSKRRSGNACPALQQRHGGGQRRISSAEHEDADQDDPPQLGGGNPAQLRS